MFLLLNILSVAIFFTSLSAPTCPVLTKHVLSHDCNKRTCVVVACCCAHSIIGPRASASDFESCGVTPDKSAVN